MIQERAIPHLCKDKDCTGCMACVNVCSHHSITISTNPEGFYRPHIDKVKCVGCGLCEKNCPVLNPIQIPKFIPKVWAGWNKNEDVRAESSSGGVFSAFAEKVINDGGVVFGVIYDDTMKVCHQMINQKEDLYKLRKSKYVQSYIGDTLRQVKELLLQGTKVMFVGTPCQCAALRSLVRKQSENLLLVDFICHGVPSPLFFNMYKKWLEDTYNDEITDFVFRGKPKGWYDALRWIKTANGKSHWLKGHKDCYWVGFNNNNNLQESCYDCRFLGFPRVSDITMADFWCIGKEKKFEAKDEIEKGVSMLVANNERGLTAIESTPGLILYERSLDEAIGGNKAAVKSCLRPQSRNTIYKDLQTMDFDPFSQKYLKPSTKGALVKLWREYFPTFLVAGVRKVLQK